jgi:hypothetical protein
VALHLDENLLTHDSGLAGLGANLVATPRFVEPGRDYRLRAGSPAVDFAQATQSDAYDLSGKPRTVDLVERPDAFGPRDLGAFERYDVGNLVLNGEFDIQRRIWETPVEASPWSVFIKSGPDASDRADSSSMQIDIPACDAGCTIPPPAPGLNVSYLRQCIHLPGPGTYTLSGKAFIADTSEGRDIPYLAWRVRRNGNENCEGFLAPGDYGFLSFDPSGAGQWKTASEQIVVIPDGEWSPRLSIEVKLDLTRNGNDPATSNVFGRFDGIRLTWSPPIAPLFSDGFE